MNTVTSSLSSPERVFLECYCFELGHSPSGGALRWLAENKLTVMDFGNLLVLYQAEGRTWGKSEPELVIPWTPEELRARNAALASETETLRSG